MNRWQKRLSAILLGAGLLISAAFPLLAHSQDAGGNRKLLYLFSVEFPPSSATQYPIPPIQETKFWQLLDKEMSATPDLALTENMEDADYQVELRCSGIINCTRLIVDVRDPRRTLLTSFNLNNVTPYFILRLGQADLKYVSHQLTQRLDKHIKLLQEGGYGYSAN